MRFNLTVWGVALSAFAIWYMVSQEILEREYPTPHEWSYLTRKALRDAKKWMDGSQGNADWTLTLSFARITLGKLECPDMATKEDLEGLIKIDSAQDPLENFADEFSPRDISKKSEEWRRGYFEALLLAARAAENVDGWLVNKTTKNVCPPEYVVGPSNPKPKPLPPGSPPPFREEDAEIAYPSAERFYLKAITTEGFTPRQRMEIGISYALFMDFKGRQAEALNLYEYAAAQATSDLPAAALPYNPKTYILKDKFTPSENVFDSVTAMANHKARAGDITAALPIYLSLLKARRSLPTVAPKPDLSARSNNNNLPIHRQIMALLSQPDYPPPPPSGMTPPWRSPSERCQEASLNLYIGEILYATDPSSREDGLAWTREGIDVAEDQLRFLTSKPNPSKADKEMMTACRECLSTGLDNWGTMVRRLLREEREKASEKPSSGVLSFFSGTKKSAESRWEAEQAVVQERVKRTRDLVENLRNPQNAMTKLFQA